MVAIALRRALLFACLGSAALAQGTTIWVRKLGDTRFDAAGQVAVDATGNAIVAGIFQTATSFDIFVTKYDPNGRRLWLRTYDSSGTDRLQAMALDASGNAYIASRSSISGSLTDIVVVKYGANGTFRWAKHYDGASKYDTPNDIAIDGKGNVAITGSSQNAAGDYDELTLCYDPAGNIRWTAIEPAPDYYVKEGHAIVFDPNGNALVGSTFHASISGEEMHVGVIKYNQNGVRVWTRGVVSGQVYKGGTKAVGTDPEGNVYVTGTLYTDAVKGFDIATYKYDRFGNLLASSVIDGGSGEEPIRLAVGTDRSVTIFGLTGTSDTVDYYTLKLSPSLGRLWSRRYNGSGNGRDYPYDMALDDDGNVVVTGAAYVATDDFDPVTLKYSPTGKLLWKHRRQTLPAPTNDRFYSLATDASGNVYLAGQVEVDSFNYDVLTMKLSP